MKKLLSLLILLAPGLMVADDYLDWDNMPKTGDHKKVGSAKASEGKDATALTLLTQELKADQGYATEAKAKLMLIKAIKNDGPERQKLIKFLKKNRAKLTKNIKMIYEYLTIVCDEDINEIVQRLLKTLDRIFNSKLSSTDIFLHNGPVCNAVNEFDNLHKDLKTLKEAIGQ